MKVVIGDQVFDSKKTPIILNWENEGERLIFSKRVFQLEPIHYDIFVVYDGLIHSGIITDAVKLLNL